MKKENLLIIFATFTLTAPLARAQVRTNICQHLRGRSAILSDGSGVAEMCIFGDGIHEKSEIDSESLRKYFSGQLTIAVNAFLKKSSQTVYVNGSDTECVKVDSSAVLLSIPYSLSGEIYQLCLFNDGSLISPRTLAKGLSSQALRSVFFRGSFKQ